MSLKFFSLKLLNRGFAALPILVVITVLSGGALFILANNTFDARHNDIQVQEASRADVMAAINGFTLAFSRAPCPDTDNDGLEDCTAIQTTGTQETGYVPYVTLGIADQRIGELAYAPYQKSLDEGLASTSNVREIELPDELPAGTSLTVPVTVPANPPGMAVDPNSAERAQIIHLLEGFYAGLITNTAVRPSLLFATSNPPECLAFGINCSPLAGAVPNRIGRSYITALRVYLAPSFTTFTNVPLWTDGDGDHNLNYAAGYAGNTNYDDVKSLADNLQKFTWARQYKELIGDDPQIIETTGGNPTGYDLPGRINALRDDISRINAGAATPTGACGTLNCVYSRWSSYRSEYNSAVSTYNAGRLSGVTALTSNSFSDPDLDGTSGATASVRTAALLAAIDSLSSSVSDGVSVLNQTISDAGDASLGGTPKTKVEELRDRFLDRRNRAQAAINYYNSRINEANFCIALSLPPGCTLTVADRDSFVVTRNRYTTARNLYSSLYSLLYNLNLDLTSSDVQVFIDRLEALQPADTSTPSLDPTSTCNDVAASYSSPPFNQADCEAAVTAGTIDAYIDGLGTPTSTPPTTTPPATTTVNYAELMNLADVCYKTQQIPTATSPSLRSGGVAAAYLLVVPGDNRVPNTPNVIAAGALNAARPDMAKTLSYDDNVLVTSPDELDNRLACAGLLNAYDSYDTAIKEIALLYDDAVSALGDAEQDQVVAIINLALVTARLAVDIGAIIQETAAGVAATVTCVASLGLAVNACVAAGLEFAAAAAHGITVITDGVNVAQAAVALADAVQSLADAQTAKDNIQAHYGLVVGTAIAADGRGGIQEFP